MFVSTVRRAPLLLIALLVLVACGTNKVALNGRVLDAYTNQPVKEASLTFGKNPAVKTDADGRYTTSGWSAKDTLSIAASGYESTTVNLAEKPELAKTEPTTATLDVTIRPNTLSGVVKDAYTNQPVGNARVQATDTISATTDANGAYTLQNLPETFQIAIEAPDYVETRADISRATTHEIALKPSVLRGTVKDTYSGQGLAGVTVKAGDATATTGADGTYELKNVSEGTQVSFSMNGYDEVQESLPQATSLDASLRPNVISGTVVDSADGTPLAQAMVIASPTITGTAVATTRTDDKGNYKLEDVPEGAYIRALLPGYRRAETQVTEGGLSPEIKLEKFEAKALYIKANVAAGGMDNVNEYYDMIDQTELNAAVIDIKSDNLADVGFIYYQSQVPQVVEAETSADYMPIREMLAEAKRRNIYTIARIHIFAHDNALLEKHPDWYVQKDGKPWFADFGIAWLDTYDERVWDYNIALGVEAAQLGFDEIQFDYIRFPSDGNLEGAVFKGPRDWRNNPDEMFNTVGRFMERAQKQINGAGAYFGVDVFGYVAWKPQPNIGQNLQIMGKYADYVYPMVYPSHFVFGELGFENPGAHPFEIVDFSMQKVKDQLIGEASRAKARPWLQDFTLIWVPDQYIVRYGAKEVRDQIDAAEKNRANGVSGWALWDSDNDYTIEALKGE
ncbi:MAG: carboxypeptidase regulatory-like domain-containing protein [Chloroflexi bacterium]|nr:carboxypeptidase regulatory-like domain-containing protein [Chloroflexota bacterium]